jgi:hypothetical protein
MFRFEEGTEASAGERPSLRLVPEPAPRLFQLREPSRRLLLPSVLAIVVHGAALSWVLDQVASRPPAAPRPVPVVLRKALPPKPAEPAGGGAPPRSAKARRKKIHVPVPPPRLAEPPPEPKEPDPEPPALDEPGEDEGDEGGTGLGSGTGSGTGIGPGTGSGSGPGTGVASKERKAWLARTDWKCLRPGMEDLGRVVVRIRVEVRPGGDPGEVTVTKPGPEPFNRRAVDCAKAEKYLPALDREGHPIPAVIEFGIDFQL